MMVVGSEDRPATPDEIWEMRIHIATAMNDGAFGISSGLTYVPGMFADTAELIELCAVVANFGGYYSPHTRSYGKGALEAYAEMIEVSRRSGCALHLTHATMNFAVNEGHAPELINLINAAIAEGIDLSLDTYPYLAGSTTLSALLPSWAAVGGPEATLERLRDPEIQAQVRYALEVLGTDGCHGVVVDWNTIEISGVENPALNHMVGKTVAQLAVDIGGDPTTLYFEILQSDRLATTILQHVGNEPNVRTMMVHHRHCGGSDGILVGGKPHPRAWGTFPRYLGHYSREEKLLTLEEAVAHLTSNPARRLGLSRRGLIKKSNFADLVLFDPDTVADLATYENPRTQAAGIHWVFVNGQPVIENGERTDIVSGYALRHPLPEALTDAFARPQQPKVRSKSTKGFAQHDKQKHR
jgi:N-acyl-D-amino-acid deacylase